MILQVYMFSCKQPNSGIKLSQIWSCGFKFSLYKMIQIALKISFKEYLLKVREALSGSFCCNI